MVDFDLEKHEILNRTEIENVQLKINCKEWSPCGMILNLTRMDLLLGYREAECQKPEFSVLCRVGEGNDDRY